jgi:NADP-dependent 3-hydroxy acid dehydrogenase YdfG
MSRPPLDEAVAVVTGAGRGIGAAIAAELARLGASVVLAARTEHDLERVASGIRAQGGSALVVPTDVTRADEARRLTERTLAELRRLDILVNNAGSARFGNVADSDPDAWWETVSSNLRGMYLCTRFALPELLRRRSGHIVNILSIAATAPLAGASAYGAAKAAGLMFTRVLATEVRAHGVRVTAVVPGATDTPLWDGMESAPDRSLMLPPERIAEAVAFVVAQGPGAVTEEIVVMPPLGVL